MTTDAVKLTLRPSAERGFADHDWLKTYHSFSFASYQDPQHEQWGPLRVLNEDRVAATQGFGFHGHKEFEIWSYVLSGELEHRDSMGNTETLRRGEVQLTSAGTGIRHSEYNRHPSKGTHFLQIWVKPNESRLTPKYYGRFYSDDAKKDVLLPIVAPVSSPDVEDAREDEANGPTPIHSDFYAYASLLSPSATVSKQVSGTTKRGYVHLATSAFRSPDQSPSDESARLLVSVGGHNQALVEGDGLYIDFGGEAGAEISFTHEGGTVGEFVYFEMST